MELILDEYKARDEIASTLRERRIITTQIFGRAWRRLCSTAHRKLVIDSFIHTGIKIAPDGSKDHRIRVKDHIDIEFAGWEISELIKEEQWAIGCDDEYAKFITEGDSDTI
jgi:hypothetical protein